MVAAYDKASPWQSGEDRPVEFLRTSEPKEIARLA
jgi:hypothetical protein